jgi:tetratricopeptide (TPR) repeat protein
VGTQRFETEVEAALQAVATEGAGPVQKTEMLVEIAMGMQKRPKTAAQLQAAVLLYREALRICPVETPLLRARTLARFATALRAVPGESVAPLEEALEALTAASPVLAGDGAPAEVAELEMNRGLVLQALASAGRARIQDAISAYQRALRVFDRAVYPKEFAILQNNLATAFLSVSVGDERAKIREALAVSAFEEGLAAVTLVDHPVEYAMLQNNLGNALQSIASSHPVENGLRALTAYDEALKVRTRRDMPLEYANTAANKAMCQWGLPDDPEDPAATNAGNRLRARDLLQEALEIFTSFGETARAGAVRQTLQALQSEIAANGPAS